MPAHATAEPSQPPPRIFSTPRHAVSNLATHPPRTAPARRMSHVAKALLASKLRRTRRHLQRRHAPPQQPRNRGMTGHRAGPGGSSSSTRRRGRGCSSSCSCSCSCIPGASCCRRCQELRHPGSPGEYLNARRLLAPAASAASATAAAACASPGLRWHLQRRRPAPRRACMPAPRRSPRPQSCPRACALLFLRPYRP